MYVITITTCPHNIIRRPHNVNVFGYYKAVLAFQRQIYRDTQHFTLYNGTFPVCPQQRTGACKCHVIVVVLRLRVQKLTPVELRLFATQCGKTITIQNIPINTANGECCRIIWHEREGKWTTMLDECDPKYCFSMFISHYFLDLGQWKKT